MISKVIRHKFISARWWKQSKFWLDLSQCIFSNQWHLQNANLDIEGWKYFIDQAFHPCRYPYKLAKFGANQFHYPNWPNNATCRLPENKATYWCSPKRLNIICTAIHGKCLRSAGLKQNVLSRCHTGKCFGWEMPKNNVNFRPKQIWNKKHWNKQICFRTQVRLLHCIGWPFNHLLSG